MPLDTSTLSHLKTLHTQADKDYDTPLYVQRYMAISPEQGQWLYELVVGRNSKNVIEFGASFGVSTIYLAAAAKQTKGHVITTEIESTKIPSLRQNLQQVNLSCYLWMVTKQCMRIYLYYSSHILNQVQ